MIEITFIDDDNKLYNTFEELPKVIGQLTNLEVLECYNNQLTELSNEISQLTNLQTLGCSNNTITIFEKEE